MGKIKKYKKPILISVGLFFFMVFIAIAVISVMAKKYVVHVNLSGNEYQDILVDVSGEGSCDVTELEREDRELVLLLEHGKKGQMALNVTCVHKENPEIQDEIYTGFKISKSGFFSLDRIWTFGAIRWWRGCFPCISCILACLCLWAAANTGRNLFFYTAVCFV